MTCLKIVSLIPSATEILSMLGLTDYMVGRSHECDYPPEIKQLPICTAPKFNPEGSSQEIHDRVTDLLQSALSVYQVNTDILQELQPTHILTQAKCDVCAVSLGDVEKAASDLLGCQPQIISLQPNLLADVWADIEQVAEKFGVNSRLAIASGKSRVQTIQKKTQTLTDEQKPKVACIEWTQPLMGAGNWMPELVTIAGGKSLFGQIGKHSPWLQWEQLLAAEPDIIIMMPCGYNLAQTKQDARSLKDYPEWANLPAVKNHQVYITDGNAYFNRPGPRLVDSLEILAEIIHPELFNFGYQGWGWEIL
jgi:iron complex transport system substrate-binding protein